MKVFLDTETTMFPENLKEDDNIMIQLATAYMNDKGNIKFLEDKNKNTQDISPQASSAHNIVEEDLIEMPIYNATKTYKTLNKMLQENKVEYAIAHNMPFDKKVLELANMNLSKVKLIDTLKVMRYINDSEGLIYDSCALQYLIYDLKLYRKRKNVYYKYDLEFRTSHDALFDVVDLILLTEWIVETYETSYEEMCEISNNPIEYTYVPTGSNKGKRVRDLSQNQLEWQAENSWDADMRYTCNLILEGE